MTNPPIVVLFSTIGGFFSYQLFGPSSKLKSENLKNFLVVRKNVYNFAYKHIVVIFVWIPALVE